jgi:hypothetical protein
MVGSLYIRKGGGSLMDTRVVGKQPPDLQLADGTAWGGQISLESPGSAGRDPASPG